VPLPGIEEEEAPTSNRRSPVNLAPAKQHKIFWRHCQGLKKKKLPHQIDAPPSTWHQQNNIKFSGAVAGEKEDFCKGSFARTSFTLF
jgi:hypothetical protein